MPNRNIRIVTWALLMGTFGKLCNIYPANNIYYYLGIVFVLLFSLELLIWISKNIR